MSYLAGFASPQILPQTNPTSAEAREVDRESAQALAKVKLGSPGRSRALDELNAVANSYGMLRTFDGMATYSRAVAFLTTLPSDVPPELSVDPDGEIAFEWAMGDDVLSVSLGASGRISYAADIAGHMSSGPAFFGGNLPVEILELLARFR